MTIFCDGFQSISESDENNNIGSTYPSRINIGEAYTLSTSVSPSGSGSVSPSSGTYDEGTQVTLTASPASGYTFDHWGGDASGTSSSTTITMNSNKSVIAYFAGIQKPDLTVTSVSAPSSAKVGDTISVTFTVKNQGGSSSGSFSNRVSLSTSSYGTTYSLGNFSMSSLGAGASSTKTVSVTIPSVSSGYYYVTIFCDGFQSISESNENNNIGSTYPSKIYIGEASEFNIGDRVRVTTNLNVRTGAGTGYPEITDPDYHDYAPAGTVGTVISGPISANGYVWWKIQYDAGYTGWSVEGGLEKV